MTPRRGRLDWGLVSRYVVLAFFAFIFVFPLAFMFSGSLKPPDQLVADMGSLRTFLPVGDLSLDNYRFVQEVMPVDRLLLNTVLISGVTVGVGLIVNSMAGFAIARLEWRGRGLFLSLVLALLILPFETIAVPLLWIAAELPMIGFENGALVLERGWLNTLHVQAFPFIANVLAIFLFAQYFRSLPVELDEAARIDGAGPFTIYRRVVLPLSGPVIATVAILTFLPIWNSYLWPLMSVQTESVRPIMIGVSYFAGYGLSGPSLALLSIAALPVLLLFLVLQRQFVQSIAATGVRG
jgi:multiple sugar transport system permease protein